MDIFFVRIKFHIEYSKVILVIELNSNRNEKIKWKVKKKLTASTVLNSHCIGAGDGHS